MGGHHGGKTLAWRLHPFHDQKDNIGSWLKKTNFIEDSEDPIHATKWLKMAHHHASHYLSHAIREYSQLFCGADNTVTNALSWDDDRSNKELTKIFCSPCPSQLPRHFKIVPLPRKVTSWLTLLLLWLPVKPQLVETHTRTTLGRGSATSNTATCNKAGLGDNIFLNRMSWQQQINIMGAFAMAVCQGNFLQQCDAPLAESTVTNTINAVAATFRENRCQK
jgi:hypothetical protein